MTTSLRRFFHACLGILALWAAPESAQAQTPTDLFFSEYVEGSSNNKALEIYNGTANTISLPAGGYVVQMYFNGATTPTDFELTGSIAPGGTYVLVYTGTTSAPANPTLLAKANQTSSTAFFNGDDAVVLRKGGSAGTILDVIGQVGFRPSTRWGTSPTSTADNTLRRKAAFCSGDANPADVFTPATEWDGFSIDTFDGLGTHTTNCGTTTPTPSLPTVSINATNASGSEGSTDPIVFTISRTGSTTAALTVNYTIGGTATNGTDYTPQLFGSATIPVGQASVTIPLTVIDDSVVDPNETIILTLTANATYGIGTASATATITDNDVVAGTTRIRNIQGAAHISPLNGQLVSNVPGIVTALRSNGFYLQDPTPDNDDRTSEGIFVFTNSAPTVQVGSSLLVSGTVAEFRASGTANANNLTITQLQGPTISLVSLNNTLPAPTLLGNGGRAIPNRIIEDQTGSVDSGLLDFDPATDGIDFYESVEGMLVQINNPLAVSPTAQSGATAGELWVVADNGANATIKSARGGVIISDGDYNPERIQLDDTVLNPPSGNFLTPLVNVGAQLDRAVGIVSWVADNYEVLLTSIPNVLSNPLTKEVTTLGGTVNQLTVSTFNVENLAPSDPASKFSNLASRIVTNLNKPDILLLEEIQDNSGATNNGVVDANVTFETLIRAITAAGGPAYQYRQINPENNADGGQAGGNIRVGFLFNPARVSFVDRAGGTSTAATGVNNVNGKPQLSFSPGRVDPTNQAFTNYDGSGPASNSRKPLAGEFIFNGQTVFIIGNHFSSKIPDDFLFGVNQPPVLNSEPQRRMQATVVSNFIKSILAIDANANVITLGDLNDFEFSGPVNILKATPLTALIETLPANERYTYNFEGNSQAIDHILVSANLRSKLDQYDVVHINAEFVNPDSDHDPSVARFTLVPPVKVAVQHRDVDNYADNNAIQPLLQVVNEGNVAVPLSNLTLRYYLTVEGAAALSNLFVNYAQVGSSNVRMRYVPLAQPTQGATGYVEYSFTPEAGTLAPGANTGAIQSYIAKADYASLNELDDYSYATVRDQLITNPRITAYYNGALVWGLEPGSTAQLRRVSALTESKNGPSATQIGTYLELRNEGNVALNYSDLKVRYYFTAEGNSPLNFELDYTALGAVQAQFVRLSTPLANADTYLELTFPNGGQLAPSSSTGLIRYRVSKADYSRFNQANDYSYQERPENLSPNSRVVVYANNQIIWGQEPGAANARLAASAEPGTALNVRVMGNPILTSDAQVEVTGALGQPLNYLLTDVNGRTIATQHVEQAGTVDRQTLKLGVQPAGMLLLRVSTPTQTITTKLIRQ